MQRALDEYLQLIINKLPEKNISIESKIYSEPFDIRGLGNDAFIIYLNFNYTYLEKLYIKDRNRDKVIHIHGELGDPCNPIIFGYGDELDSKFGLIEQENDNRYLKNIKSIKYVETGNYQDRLFYLDSANYEIFIMGHSCGISDRTLLNTLFEHDNCKSIKVFYHKKENGTDNYSDIIMNIYRNFSTNKKYMFRAKVINKEKSECLLDPYN
jgi:hypothetical protein